MIFSFVYTKIYITSKSLAFLANAPLKCLLCVYLSNRAQNDLIYAMGGVVLKKIVEDIKNSQDFHCYDG